MSTVDPAAFRLRAFESHWRALLRALRREAPAGSEQLIVRLKDEAERWVSLGRETDYFPRATGSAQRDSPSRTGGAHPGSIWEFERALSRALDFLDTDQLTAVSLLLFADEKNWAAAKADAARLAEPGQEHSAEAVDSVSWLLQEWPWDESAGDQSGGWASDWRLSGLPSVLAQAGTGERLDQAQQLREAIRSGITHPVESAAPVRSLRERLSVHLEGSLAVLSASMRPQPVMGDADDSEVPMTVTFDAPPGGDATTEARGFRSETQLTVWVSNRPPGQRVLLALGSEDELAVAEQDVGSATGRVLRFELPWPYAELPTQMLVAVFE